MFIVMASPASQCLPALPIKTINNTVLKAICMGKFNHWLQICLFMYNIGMSVFKLSQYIVLIIAALGVVKIIILNCTACI